METVILEKTIIKRTAQPVLGIGRYSHDSHGAYGMAYGRPCAACPAYCRLMSRGEVGISFGSRLW